jgi:hypothetical protein
MLTKFILLFKLRMAVCVCVCVCVCGVRTEQFRFLTNRFRISVVPILMPPSALISPDLMQCQAASFSVKFSSKFYWDIMEIGWEVVDWMLLAQDRGQWRAVGNTVMNIRVP